MNAPRGDKTGTTQGCVYVKMRQTERLQTMKAAHWHQEQPWLWKNPAPGMSEVESMSTCVHCHNPALTFSRLFSSLKHFSHPPSHL